MAKNEAVRISPLRESELGEAIRIVRLAFGTFLGLPDPMQFMGDRDLMTPRWRARNTRVLAAHIDGRLVGSNVITRWGSFGFFGPLTVLPEFWDHGVAQRLMEGTVKVLDRWKLRRSGLFTFAQSAKHVGLYNKFGFWPGYLTALMRARTGGRRTRFEGQRPRSALGIEEEPTRRSNPCLCAADKPD